MCRYAFSGPYKHHFVCFDCRKAFKQPAIEDYLTMRGWGEVYRQLVEAWNDRYALAEREKELGARLADLQTQFSVAERKCPECGKLMVDLGLDLKPPRKTDVRAWKKLQGMFTVGHEWRTCGCNGPGWIPKSTADYRHYLTSTLRAYQKNLKFAQQRTNTTTEEKRDAVDYWGSRIDLIQAELQRLGSKRLARLEEMGAHP